MSRSDIEKEIEKYMRKIEPFINGNQRVYVRKDFAGGWELINITEVDDWAEELGWRDLHVSLQRFAVNEEVNDESIRFMDLIIELDDAKEKGELALEETRKLVSWFTQFEPRPGDIRIWFSGNKGFHIIISGVCLGLIPSKDIHVVGSYIAGKICQEVGISTMDYQMYSKKKTIRLPNSRHTKPFKQTEDGPMFLYKIELSPDEVMGMNMSEIRYIASSQRKPLYSLEEVDSNGPNVLMAPFITKIRKEYENMRLEVEAVERKISFPEKLKGKLPVCIKDIMKYQFSKYQRRNKAMLSLIGFFKDSGRSQEEVVKIVEDWTRGIPWDTQKERERLAQVKPATIVAFNADGDGYDFSCRKCQSINKDISPDEPRISCKGASCQFVEDPLEQGVTSDVSVNIDELEKTASVKDFTKYRASVYIDKYDQKTFNIPRIVRGRCRYVPSDIKTHDDICAICSMPYIADNANQNPGEPAPLSLEKRVLGHNGDALKFVDVKDSFVKQLIFAMFGVPKECPQFKFHITTMQKVMQLLISSPKEIENSYADKEKEGSTKEVNCHDAFMVIKDKDLELPEEGEHITTNVAVVTDSKDQSSRFFLYNWKRELNFLDSFVLTKDLHTKLHEAHAVKPNESLEQRIKKRVDNMGLVTGLVGVEELHLMIDIIYHTPLTIKIGNKEDRGFAHGVIVGDPCQGKSTAFEKLAIYYGLGVIEDGANSRRTGLLYTIDNNRKFGARVVWGTIPRLDRQIIAIEEFNELPKDTLEKMTQARSTGVVRVTGQASGSTRVRTRMVMMSNPPSESGNLDNYVYGISAIRHAVKKSQDLRRFDLAMVMPSDKKSMTKEMWEKAISTDKPEPGYSSFMCRNLILWAWTRKKSQIRWDDMAVSELQTQAESVASRFKCDAAIVEPKDMGMRLGRIAQGVAAMVYSSSEGGEILWVMPEHVRFAANFFSLLLTRVGNMDLDIYAMAWREMNVITDEQERWLEGTLRIQPWFQMFCRSIMDSEVFTERFVRDLIDTDNENKNMFFRNLIGSGFLKYPPGKMLLTRAPKLTKWLKSHLQNMIGHLEAPKIFDPTDGDTIAEEVNDGSLVYVDEDDTGGEF